MNILEALHFGESELSETYHEKRFDIHNAKLDAQFLLAEILQKSPSYLVMHMEDEISSDAAARYQDWISRRKQHEPIAYITGKKGFYKREFLVNESTLIPRPETESLIEYTLPLIKDGTFIADIGTGSGAIAITLACETRLPIIATDMSSDALEIARKNAKNLHVEHLITFSEGSLLDPILNNNVSLAGSLHGVIIANLPYIPERDWDFLDPDVKNFEPQTAITSGIDGFDHYRALLKQISESRDALPKTVDLLIEIDPRQKDVTMSESKKYIPSSTVHFIEDLNGKTRFAHFKVK